MPATWPAPADDGPHAGGGRAAPLQGRRSGADRCQPGARRASCRGSGSDRSEGRAAAGGTDLPQSYGRRRALRAGGGGRHCGARAGRTSPATCRASARRCADGARQAPGRRGNPPRCAGVCRARGARAGRFRRTLRQCTDRREVDDSLFLRCARAPGERRRPRRGLPRPMPNWRWPNCRLRTRRARRPASISQPRSASSPWLTNAAN